MRKSIDIPSLPTGLASIVSVANSESATAEDVAHAIMLDPALSTKVLRMANSAFYGRLTRAETVTQAVVTLGFGAVRTIALAASVVDHILPEEGVPGLDWRLFWQHCVATGAAAEIVSRKLTGCKRGGESAFVAGLLHDVGKLIIARNTPNTFGSVVKSARMNNGDFQPAERQVLGTDHTEVGAMLVEAWRIPDVIGDPVSQHHADTPVEDTPPGVLSVRAANLISKKVYGHYLVDYSISITEQEIGIACGLDQNSIEEIAQQLPERLAECEEVLNWGQRMPQGKSKPKAA